MWDKPGYQPAVVTRQRVLDALSLEVVQSPGALLLHDHQKSVKSESTRTLNTIRRVLCRVNGRTRPTRARFWDIGHGQGIKWLP